MTNEEIKIHISEIFYSIQGEGKLVGQPSIFIRVWGCNFECPGFGVERNKVLPSSEYIHNTIDLNIVSDFNSLPVPKVGCDSSMSWSKRFKDKCITYGVDELLKKCYEICDEYKCPFPAIVLTGGEPLLRKYQKFWTLFLDKIPLNCPDVTFETNGTQKLIPDLIAASKKYNNIIFSISPKLSISGEDFPKTTIKKEFVDTLRNNMLKYYLKFVVRDEQCIKEVEQALEIYYNNDTSNNLLNVYIMPEGAILEQQSLIEKDVANLCMRYGYKFSPRLHIQLFGNQWGT